MLKTTIGRFRFIGFIEGVSLLSLLFIAMPLKYAAGFPEAVRVVGPLHGFCFILYLLVIAYTTFKIRWSLKWIVSAVAVAFIPFGNIILDTFLKRSSFFEK
jgi:integral membrane protein